MPLIHIDYGSLASSETMNDNFEYLDARITTVANSLASASTSIYSSLSGINTSLSGQIDTLASGLSDLDDDLDDLSNAFNSQNNAPDYSRGVGITLPYTAEADGYVYAGVDGTDAKKYVYVNQKIVHGHCGYSGGYNVYSGSLFRVSSGDIVSVDRNSGPYYFYPMKGD
jgi:hypothetical protein